MKIKRKGNCVRDWVQFIAIDRHWHSLIESIGEKRGREPVDCLQEEERKKESSTGFGSLSLAAQQPPSLSRSNSSFSG